MQSRSWLPLGAFCKANAARLMMSSFRGCSLIDPRPEQHKDTTHFGGQEKRPKGRGDEKEQALWLTARRSAMSGGVGGAYTPEARSPLPPTLPPPSLRSEEHTSELQSLMRISYAVFCLKKKKKTNTSYVQT